MAQCTLITDVPPCEHIPFEVNWKLDGLSCMIRRDKEGFSFDPSVHRHYWYTDVPAATMEVVLKFSSEREWVEAWRRQYDEAIENMRWNEENAQGIYWGRRQAKPTLVMGKDVSIAENVLGEFMIRMLKAEKMPLSFTTTRGDVSYHFMAAQELHYAFRDNYGTEWIRLFCRPELPQSAA